MLDPEFKAKWVAALESGEYQQAHSHLYGGGRYCCLGVACVVAGAKFKPDSGSVFAEMSAYRGDEIISDENTSLAGNFLQEIGLSDQEQMKLYRMNDGHLPEEESNHIRRHTFNEIAAYIKENL